MGGSRHVDDLERAAFRLCQIAAAHLNAADLDQVVVAWNRVKRDAGLPIGDAA